MNTLMDTFEQIDPIDRIEQSSFAIETGGPEDELVALLPARAIPSGNFLSQSAPIGSSVIVLADIPGTDGNDTLNGTDDPDTIRGLNGSDQINGLGGNDTLFGGNGDDTLNGDVGADMIDGGDGFDIASYRTAVAGVVIDLAASSSTWSGEARGDALTSIEAFQLTDSADIFFGDANANVAHGFDGPDQLFGLAGDDFLTGGDGDDRLFGGADNDLLRGGGGADVIDGGTGFDTLSYIGAGGGVRIDLTASSATWTGAARGDTLTSIEEIVLTDFDDVFRGDAGANIVRSSDGVDQLFGFGGNDALTAGDGDDFLFGGADNDTLNGASGADTVDGGDGFDIASYRTSVAGVRIDLAASSSTWTGVARGDTLISIEELDLSDVADVFRGDANANIVKGFDGDDQLLGFAGDDTLYGGAGNDTVDGGAGHDLLGGGAGADIITGGEGSDHLTYADATGGVSIDLTKSSSTWTGDAQGDTLTSIESFELTNFGDVFRGDAANNHAVSGAGDDELYGGGGNDTLAGDAGNDTIQGGEGIDFIVGDDFGNFAPAGDDYLQGNAGDDTMFGGGGNDKLVGGTGNDKISGDRGGDTLIGNEGADSFRYFRLEDSQDIIVNGVRQQDQIVDFVQGEDTIDLVGVDANAALGGNQAFTFLADPAHHGDDWTGLVWSVTDARGITTVYASNDADGDAEMSIYMSHGYTFTANDFIL